MYLVIGQGPLPFEKGTKHQAAGLRTVQFIYPFLREKEFLLITIHDDLEKPEKTEKTENSENFEPTPYPHSKGFWLKISKDEALKGKLAELCFKGQSIKNIEWKALIGVNNFAAYVSALLHDKCFPEIPFWADLNGWMMAKGVSQALSLQTNFYLPHYFQMEKTILAHADAISTVSERQKWCVYGELMSLGWLNDSFAEDFIFAVPNAQNPSQSDFNKITKTQRDDFYRKYGIPQDKWYVLSVGSFNTWMDIDTLFDGLEKAMEQNPELHFIAAGKSVTALNDTIFENFQKKVLNSKYKDRFHLLGWVEKEEIHLLYSICHLGVNIDIMNIETATGARNRLTEMMFFGLPVLTTEGTEIAAIIQKEKLGFVIIRNNAHVLAKKLLEVAQLSKKERKSYADRALEYCTQHFEPNSDFFRNFSDWLEKPLKRPKIEVNLRSMGKMQLVKKFFSSLKDNGFKKTFRYVGRHWKKF